MEKEIERLNAEAVEFRRRLDKLEDANKRHEEDIRQLYATQEGTKVYVTQILNKLEQLETKLFSLVTQLAHNREQDETEDRKERQQATKYWLDFAKYLISATIGALLIYLFTGGAK